MKYLFLLLCSVVALAQQHPKVDFTSLQAHVYPNTVTKSITGSVLYHFTVNSKIDTIAIDAKRMNFKEVYINHKKVNFKVTPTTLKLYEGFKKGKNELRFTYEASPKQTLYFIGDFKAENAQIWTQGQGKFTSHWLPSFDDVNEKLIFNITVTFDSTYEVITNGALHKVTHQTETGLKTWQYNMSKPMSSYLVMMAIGRFIKQNENSVSGTPLEMYLQPNDYNCFKTTYAFSKEIFDFLENEIGVKYPWGIYRQVPVNDFLYAGMENTTATLFSQDFVVDQIGFNDKTYININAHELAHHWFGDLVTAQSGKHHWLQEGFATYYALLAEKKLFGDDYFDYELYQSAETLQRVSQTDTIPILNEKASSLTFYQKGAWALHALRDEMGAEKFKKAVRNFVKKYEYKTATTDNFLDEVTKVYNINIVKFKKTWLENTKFPVKEALDILRKNKFIVNYMAFAEKHNLPFKDKKEEMVKLLQSDAFIPLKEEVLYQLVDVPFEEKEPLLQLALQSGNVKVRQAVAQTVQTIPLSFKVSFETLLDDASYITQEIALKKLWVQFPEDRQALLNKTISWIGFNDKNLRITWLSLALATQEYKNEEKVLFYDELLNYASPNFGADTRQYAIVNLLFLNKNDQNVLGYLANGLTHHKWQFSKFCKEKIKTLVKQEVYKKYFQELLPKLTLEEQ